MSPATYVTSKVSADVRDRASAAARALGTTLSAYLREAAEHLAATGENPFDKPGEVREIRSPWHGRPRKRHTSNAAQVQQ